MSYYAQVFDCEVVFYDYNDLGWRGPSNHIAHSYFRGGPVQLVGLDRTDYQQFRSGEFDVAIWDVGSEEKASDWLYQLSRGSRVVRDLGPTSLGGYSGIVVDQFRVGWLISPGNPIGDVEAAERRASEAARNAETAATVLDQIENFELIQPMFAVVEGSAANLARRPADLSRRRVRNTEA